MKMSIDPRIMRLSHGYACPRRLAAWGAGRPVGPDVRGLASESGGFQAGFFEAIMAHFTIR
jgi:hypothetical protein